VLLTASEGRWGKVSAGNGKKLEDEINFVMATAGRACTGCVGLFWLAEASFHCTQEIAGGQLYAELFSDFTLKSFPGGFSEVNVPAGQECVAMLAVSAQQELTLVNQNAAGDKLYCLFGHI